MELGGLDFNTENATEDKVVNINAGEKRKPFHYWTVSGKDYKLKLKSGGIEKLENKYKQNIMNMIDDIPPLTVMLTIIQAAITPWEHGITYQKIQAMYDAYVDEGGNQMELYTKVIIPTMAVSGFFTEKMAKDILEDLQNI